MVITEKPLRAITLDKCIDFRHRQILADRLSLGACEDCPDVVLNISSLRWINVFTISAILKLHEHLRGRGRRLYIRGCSEEVHGAFL